MSGLTNRLVLSALRYTRKTISLRHQIWIANQSALLFFRRTLHRMQSKERRLIGFSLSSVPEIIATHPYSFPQPQTFADAAVSHPRSLTKFIARSDGKASAASREDRGWGSERYFFRVPARYSLFMGFSFFSHFAYFFDILSVPNRFSIASYVKLQSPPPFTMAQTFCFVPIRCGCTYFSYLFSHQLGQPVPFRPFLTVEHPVRMHVNRKKACRRLRNGIYLY